MLRYSRRPPAAWVGLRAACCALLVSGLDSEDQIPCHHVKKLLAVWGRELGLAAHVAEQPAKKDGDAINNHLGR